jgi:hypothetical protein
MPEINKKVKKKFLSTAMKQVVKLTTRREYEELLEREANRQRLLEWHLGNKNQLEATIRRRETTIRVLAITGTAFFLTSMILVGVIIYAPI